LIHRFQNLLLKSSAKTAAKNKTPDAHAPFVKSQRASGAKFVATGLSRFCLKDRGLRRDDLLLLPKKENVRKHSRCKRKFMRPKIITVF
jgi:hypothetical protein